MKDLTFTDVRCLKGDSSFLIDDGKTSILYDTGFGFTGDSVAENIKKVLGDRSLDYIFLTHSHYDHALGTPYILRHYPSAKVVAGIYADSIFKREGAKKIMAKLDREYAEECGMADYEFLGDELKVDITVDDGDIINAGDMNFEVVNLPGHTTCSVGFFCREKGLLLSSETLGVYDGKKFIMPSFLKSYRQTLESIDKARKLDVKNIVMAHYGLLDENQSEYFLTHMKEASENYAAWLLERLKKGMTPEEIIKEFKDNFWHGYLKEIYPEAALNLNASIMIELIRKELMEDAD